MVNALLSKCGIKAPERRGTLERKMLLLVFNNVV